MGQTESRVACELISKTDKTERYKIVLKEKRYISLGEIRWGNIFQYSFHPSGVELIFRDMIEIASMVRDLNEARHFDREREKVKSESDKD